MTLLIASIVALAVGPAVYRSAATRPSALRFLDGFLVVTICGVVLLRVFPEVLREGGVFTVALLAAGLVGPTMVERAFHRAARKAHIATLAFALAGMGVHAALDGAALVSEGHLPLAVVLHRLPVGLTVWWLVRPIAARAGFAVLGMIAAMTVVGYVAAPAVSRIDHHALAWLEAIVAGSVLHVVLHRYPGAKPATQKTPRWDDGVGALVGVGVLAYLLGRDVLDHDPATLEFVGTFLSLALESAFPLLIAYVMAGWIAVFLPASTVAWMRRGGAAGRALRGMAVGLPFPICSCGVVPLYRSFVERGVPATAAMAFLVATPELGLDAVLLSIPLLGLPMTGIRVLGAAVVALAVGWWVGRGVPSREARTDEAARPLLGASRPDAPLGTRIREGLRTGLGDVVDHTGSWILLGLVIAAGASPLLEAEWLRSLPSAVEVAMFALLGLPVYVCASGATPLVAVMIAQGVSPGAGLAFLLTGPATNLTTLGVLTQLHGRSAAARFGLSMLALSCTAGWTVDLLWPDAGADAAPGTAAGHASALQWVSLSLLGTVFAFSLVRLGARRFLFENLLPAGPTTHTH